MKIINQGAEFQLTQPDGAVLKFRREADDQQPEFAYERLRVTHLSHSMVPNLRPYTFTTGQEWFRQRRLVAREGS